MPIEIKKVKTTKDHVWDLTINGTKVGQAEAHYKTKTQRTWVGKVSIPMEDGTLLALEHDCANGKGNSVRALITAFSEQLEGKELKVPAAPKKPVKKKFASAITISQVTPQNAFEVSVQFGYGQEHKGKQRTAEEQCAYVQSLMRAAAEETAKLPMSDLVEKSKQGPTETSSHIDFDDDEPEAPKA